jgi:D-xylose transport system permease protein
MSETLRDTTPAGSQANAAAVEVSSYRQQQTFGQRLRNDLGFIPVLLTLIAIATYFAITTNGLFLNTGNLSNLLQQIITTGVSSLGVTLVLLLGEIDLSGGNGCALGACWSAGRLRDHDRHPGWRVGRIY